MGLAKVSGSAGNATGYGDLAAAIEMAAEGGSRLPAEVPLT